MSRFDSVLNKLAPDKKKAINKWLKKVTSPATVDNPAARNIAENLKAEEHFEEAALERFLNRLGNELKKSPDIGKNKFKEIAGDFILKGDRVNIKFPSNKHYRLICLDDLRVAMKIPFGEKEKALPLIIKRYKNRSKKPIRGNIGFNQPVWSTFSWPAPGRPYDGLTPKRSLNKSGITWIKEEDAMELIFLRDAVDTVRYPTVADAGWNRYFKASGKKDPFGYTQDLDDTKKKGFPEVVHANARLQDALVEPPKPLR